MKKHITLITLSVITIFTTTITTHPVDLPVSEEMMAEHADHFGRFEALLKDKKLNNTEVYSIQYALSLTQDGGTTRVGRERHLAFPSATSEDLFKEIKQTYNSLTAKSQEEADAYLGRVLVKLNNFIK